MTLSMWILKDWLGDLSPSISCKHNKIGITGIRFYRHDMPMEDYALYIGTSDNFFNDGGKNVVCRNQDDYMTLNTDDLPAVFNRIQDAFSMYSRWLDSCAQSVAEGCSLQSLLNIAAEVFPAPLLIVDAAQIFVAQSANIEEFENPEDMISVKKYSSIPEEKLIRFNLVHRDSFFHSGIFSIPAGFFPTKSYCRHIFINEERLGTLILKSPPNDCSTGVLHLLELFAPLVEDWIQSNAGEASAFRLTSYFACSLRGNTETLRGLQRQLTLFGWNAESRKQIFVICAPGGDLRFDVHLIRSLVGNELGNFVTLYEKRLAVLCNLDLKFNFTFMENLHELLQKNGYSAAASFCFSDLSQLFNAYRQASNALDNSPQAPGKVYRCQDVAMRMIAKIVREHDTETLLHPALADISEYDRENSTEYYETLFAYLRNERHNQQTADDLFIHRNTLFLRLRKIQELWSLDFDDAGERFYLLFSFYQRKLGGKP